MQVACLASFLYKKKSLHAENWLFGEFSLQKMNHEEIVCQHFVKRKKKKHIPNLKFSPMKTPHACD